MFVVLMFFRFRQQSKKNKLGKTEDKAAFFVVTTMILFVSAFRHEYATSDTGDYMNWFIRTGVTDIESLSWLFEKREWGFFLFQKILYMISPSPLFFMMASSAVIIIPFCFFVRKYSDDIYISFLFFISYEYFPFFMAGIRQAIAMVILISSYKYIRDRKLIKFLLCVYAAYTFHNTAIVFAFAYFIVNLKGTIKQFTVIIVSFLLALIGKDYVTTFLFEILNWDRINSYEKYGGTVTFSGFIILFLILLFCSFYRKKVLARDEKNIHFYNLMYVGVACQAFSEVIGEFFRVSMYFSVFSVILLSKAISVEEHPIYKKIIYILVVIAFGAYLFFRGYARNYLFFWQY